jgi:prefoldin subunit 2
MAQKIGDIEQEAEEHKYFCLPIFKMLAIVTFIRLVIETLEPLPLARKCFRMVNGVLVERTVKDVLPALKTNSDGLKQVLDELVKQYQSKQSELDDWKVSLPMPGNFVNGIDD